MGELVLLSPVERIGETAGVVWRYLHASGPVPLTSLTRDLDVPRDLLMQALGWLAREDKLDILETKRKKTVALKP